MIASLRKESLAGASRLMSSIEIIMGLSASSLQCCPVMGFRISMHNAENVKVVLPLKQSNRSDTRLVIGGTPMRGGRIARVAIKTLEQLFIDKKAQS